MSELWIPQTNQYPDVSNIYDIMMVFQDKIDEHEELESSIDDVRIAVTCMSKAIHRLRADDKEVNVATRAAILDSVEEVENPVRILQNDIGLAGTLLDVHAEPLELDGIYQYYLTLRMDVMSMYPLAEPTNGDFLLRQGSVPIIKVDYIETAA